MALQLYLGNSGTGKSYALYSKVIEEAQCNLNERFLVLVPEQFTMQTQRDFVSMHPCHGIWNIDILSFERLAYRIFSEVGGNHYPVMDEIGKTFIVRKVAKEQQDKLQVLGGSLNKIGFINEMKSLISEFLQYDIDLEKLDNMIALNQNNGYTAKKLEDMKCIYEAFKAYTKEKYITSEEILDVLCRVIDRSEWIKGMTIVLDGYTGFTPIQKRLVKHLMRLSKDIRITVTFDSRLKIHGSYPDYHLFYMSSRMLKAVEEMAEETGTKRLQDIILDAEDNYRFADNEPLKALEKNIFRSQKSVYEKEQSAISLNVCKNPLQEVLYTANEITRLVKLRDYRFKDIAVVTGNMETYGMYVKYIFSQYQIPCFVDQKRAVLNHPAVEFIRAAMAVVTDSYSYRSMMRFLRSEFSGVSQSVCDEMENYILAVGIRGRKKWTDKWVQKSSVTDAEAVAKLDAVRAELIENLEEFYQVFHKKSTTVVEKSTALFGLMTKFNIYHLLKEKEAAFMEEGSLALGKEYAQIYKSIVSVLDKIVQLIGEEKIEPEEYTKLLEAGFLEQKIGIIPPGMDEVVFGDIERTRLKDIKALFFLGVNDGTIPSDKGNAGILSELERNTLEEAGIELAAGAREQYFNQRYYLYLNMTKPKERLYICFSKAGVLGSGLLPSYLIEEIQSIFPACRVEDREEYLDGKAAILSEKEAFSYLINQMAHISEMEEDEKQFYYSLYHWFEEQGNGAYLQQIRNAKQLNRVDGKFDRAVAKLLYGTVLNGSVTRFEKFAECAYKHYLEYGLMLKNREEAGFAGIDFGNIMHEVLKKYFLLLEEQQLSWADELTGLHEELISRCLDEAITEYGNQAIYFTARDKYQIQRMKRIAKRTVWALGKQFAAGSFKPSEFEVAFRSVEQLTLDNEEKASMQMFGRIDRIDIFEDEADKEQYVKIVDYKTGIKNFKLLHVYEGLSLQLVLYLDEAMRQQGRKAEAGDKKILPAAILYYHVDDPMIEKQENEGDVAKKLLNELKVEGILSEEKKVLQAFDYQLSDEVTHTEKYTSAVVPVTLNRNGSLDRYSKVLPQKDFLLLTKYVRRKACEIGTEILEGKIKAEPVLGAETDGCKYCEYHSICRFDEKIDGFEYRQLENVSDSKVMAKIMEEESEKEPDKKEEGVKADGNKVDG